MGSAIDLFVSYRFLKLLTTPFEKSDAYKLGIIDKKGHRILKENNIEFDNEISEEVVGFGEILPKGNYVLVNDILNKEDEEISATKGDLVMTFEDQSPVDTILGIDIFPVIHIASNEKIFVSLEDIKDE